MGVVVMKGWGVRIGLDLSVDAVKISGGLLDWLYKQIGCRIVQMVQIPADVFGRDDIILMVDEEGLLKEDPHGNLVASVLCGQTIVGNAVLLRVGETEDGDLDWMGLKDWDEAAEICGQTYVTVVTTVERLKGGKVHEED